MLAGRGIARQERGIASGQKIDVMEIAAGSEANRRLEKCVVMPRRARLLL